jgi:mono/diheme cytochrome c family protein
MSRSTWLVVVSTLVLVGLPSRAASAEESPSAVFEAHCQKCHGPDGKGDTPVGKAMKVVNLADPKWAGEDLSKLIRENPKHAAFIKKLSDAQIEATAARVKEISAAAK